MIALGLLCIALLVAALAWRRRCLALVAQASHELRGPLQSALLGLHALGEAGDGGRAAAIQLELRRAALAVEDLSAALNGRRATGAAEDVELGALLEEAAEGWRLVARRRGVALVVEPAGAALVVRAERLRLAQALSNLVANAIEHGGGEVGVRLRPGPGGARVEVTDGGAGLPAPLSELVASARGRRERRGHGLALAAVIARRHGGRLITAPSPRGARLVLELPAGGAPVAAGRRISLVVLVRDAARAPRRLERVRRPLPLRHALDAPAPARRVR